MFFKRGDQSMTYGGYRHNEPISVIDPEEWVVNHGTPPVFSESNNDLIAFASLFVPRSQLQVIKAAISSNSSKKMIEMGNRHKDESGNWVSDPPQYTERTILDDSLPIFDFVRASWDAAGVSVAPLQLTEEQCSSLLKVVPASAPSVKDNNAWTSGSKTYGSGGDYLLRSTMYADINGSGAATGDMTATQVSDITESGIAEIDSFNMGGYTYFEDGQNYKSICNVYNNQTVYINISNMTGRITHTRLNIVAGSGTYFYAGWGVWNVVVYGNNVGGVYTLKNSRFQAKTGANISTFILFLPAYYTYVTVMRAFNLMIDGGNVATIPCEISGSLQSLENCLIMNSPSAVGLGTVQPIKNTIFLNDATNFFTGFVPATTENCATDKSSVGGITDTAPQTGIVASNEFASVDIQSLNAFKLMLVGGQLIGRGEAPINSDNTSGFYGTSRPGRAGYFSIGPDEPKLDETLLGVGLTSNGVASLGNDGTFSTNVTVGGGGYNNGHLLLGSNHLWIDSTGNLRVKYGAPGYDSDGTVIGSQS